MNKILIIFSTLLLLNMPVSAACLLEAINDFGIDFEQSTDPLILRDILKEDMALDEVPILQTKLRDILKNPTPIKPMLMQIQQSLSDDHPAIREFLCKAHEKKLLEKFDSKRFLNHVFLLDNIVKAMIDDHLVMTAVYNQFMLMRQQYGIRDGLMTSTIDIVAAGGGLFGAVKAKTMDLALKMYIDIRERGSITGQELRARTNGLKLNILEAVQADSVHLHLANAYAGRVLKVIPPDTIRVTDDSAHKIQYVLDKDWTELYQTWNFAFVLGNLSYFHLTAAKLLIPSVLCAKPHDYLFNRVLALWPTINFHLLATLNKRDDAPIKHKDELVELWGKINFQYAKQYIGHKKGANKKTTDLFEKMQSKNF